MLKIGQVADVYSGYAFRSKDLTDDKSGIPVIKIGNIVGSEIDYTNTQFISKSLITPKLDHYFLEDKDILIAMTGQGSVGRVGQLRKKRKEDKLLLNQRVGRFVVDEKKYDRDFLFYILSSSEYQKRLFSLGYGSGQPNLSPSTIKDVDIPDIPLNEQKKISIVLASIEDRIENGMKIHDTLFGQASALFDIYFSDINVGGSKIGNYLVPRRGKPLLSKNAVPGKVPVVAGGLDPATYHNVANTEAPVITISASGANAGYVNLWHEPVWSSDSSFIDSSVTDSVYFWYILLKKKQKEIFDAQTGSAQPHIYQQHISDIEISAIDENDISRYDLQVAPLFEMAGRKQKEKQILMNMKNILLPMMLEGKVDLGKINM